MFLFIFVLKLKKKKSQKYPVSRSCSQFLQTSTTSIETWNQFYIRSSPSCWNFECLIKSSIYSFQDRTGLTFAQLILHILGFISRKIAHITGGASLKFEAYWLRRYSIRLRSSVTPIVQPSSWSRLWCFPPIILGIDWRTDNGKM